MNQGGYFGQYQGGFQTMPKNAYEMMTAPSKQIAGAVTNTVGKLADAYTGRAAELEGAEALKQGSVAQYKSLESLSKATGVQVNPELANQFMNMNEMKTRAQQAAFQNSLNQEAQNMMTRYNINQAQARAGQAQGMQQMQQSVYAGLGTVPPPDPLRYGGQPVMPMGQNQIDPSLLPSYPSLFVSGYGDRVGPLRPMNQR